MLFFRNRLKQGGDYHLEYLARVIAEGEATAPPAKIEEMYHPQRHGLSKTHDFVIGEKFAAEVGGVVAVREPASNH